MVRHLGGDVVYAFTDTRTRYPLLNTHSGERHAVESQRRGDCSGVYGVLCTRYILELYPGISCMSKRQEYKEEERGNTRASAGRTVYAGIMKWPDLEVAESRTRVEGVGLINSD